MFRKSATLWVALFLAASLTAQNTQPTAPAAAPPSAAAPLTLTLQDALQRARAINPEYRAAVTELGVAREDRVQARAALLPNVSLTGQFVYTEGHGLPGVGRFIANNGIHEYITQSDVKQVVSLGNAAEYRRANAAAALAQARAEIARRGLEVTVTQAFYGLAAMEHKFANAQRSVEEARKFYDNTVQLEQGGEVAHADAIRAQLQFIEKQRVLAQSELEMNRARLDLAVLTFADFNQNFTVVEDSSIAAVPNLAEVQQAAAKQNPQLKAALAALDFATEDRLAALNGFFPSLTLDYYYGIDANQYAANGVFDPVLGRTPRNLGYAAAATLELPVWNWGANRSRFKQANLRQQQARVELTATQRELLANLQGFYQELRVAHDDLEALNNEVQLATDSLRLTTLRYQAGEAAALEVVDAQNTLLTSRNALDDARLRFHVANATLQTLTGTF